MPYKRHYKKRPSFNARVKKIIARNTEVKDVTLNIGSATTPSQSINSDGTLTQLFVPPAMMAQGAGSDQRIGTEVTLLSMKLQILMSQQDAPFNRMRYAIIKTRNRPGGVVSLFNNTSYTTFTGVFADWNYDVVERVYLDKQVLLRTSLSSIPMTKFAKHFVKTPDKLHFQTNLSGPQEGWYLLVISDSDPASVLHPKINLTLNARYTDS